jgi:cellulose synthase/poly-beta-1,6-N-acetylglucosamine synthase-like glycosyltransferase
VTFSIIVPFGNLGTYLRETVRHVVQLRDPDWELILVPDEPAPAEWDDDRIRIVASGRVGPAAKRDLAARASQGEILVFIDDDSYPAADLLDAARPYFEDPSVAAVGGPALTPPEDAFWQRVSGTVFLSRLSGGAPERYVPIGPVRAVSDWPSVNFMIRRSDFLAIGGFDTSFWPGEDTKLCLELTRAGRTILYVPELIVWHHRRSNLATHLKQVGAYGLHRGFFAKKYPETSRKPVYFLPSALVMFALLSFFAFALPGPARWVVVGGWALYSLSLLKALIDFLAHERLAIALCAVWYTVCTHIVYGIRFLQGLVFTRRLVSTLR